MDMMKGRIEKDARRSAGLASEYANLTQVVNRDTERGMEAQLIDINNLHALTIVD